MAIDSALGRLGAKAGVCTSSTRPVNPFEGQIIYESDTNRTLIYDNSAWLVIADNQVLSIDTTNERVGIGTTTPADKLHVEFTNGSAAGIVLTNSGGTVGKKGMRIGFDNDRLSIQRASDSGAWEANHVAIDQDTGNVGIGTTSPATALEVAGHVSTRHLYPTAIWCGLSGAESFKSAYWNYWTQIAWNGYTGAGEIVVYPHIDTSALKYDGIEIFRTGHYLVQTAQRANATGSLYFGIGESGSRSALAGVNNDRGSDGIWSHDHSNGANEYSHSYFIGRLYDGDIITSGPPDSTTAGWATYGTGNWSGYLSVIYLGDHDGT